MKKSSAEALLRGAGKWLNRFLENDFYIFTVS